MRQLRRWPCGHCARILPSLMLSLSSTSSCRGPFVVTASSEESVHLQPARSAPSNDSTTLQGKRTLENPALSVVEVKATSAIVPVSSKTTEWEPWASTATPTAKCAPSSVNRPDSGTCCSGGRPGPNASLVSMRGAVFALLSLPLPGDTIDSCTNICATALWAEGPFSRTDTNFAMPVPRNT